MKIEHTEVFGFRAALRGMRNSRESWERSDSEVVPITDPHFAEVQPEAYWIGPNDLKLCCKLIKAGTEHRKFLRQIQVWVDMTLPRYIWTEMDTYKIATVRNSVSSMDKMGKVDLSREDFQDGMVMDTVLEAINNAAEKYRLKEEYCGLSGYDIVRHIKKILPESYLMKSTMTFNYETLLTMYKQRRKHRLPEWSGPDGICKWIESLPYMPEFIEATKK